VLDDAQPAEDELARVGRLPEPVKRYIADTIAFRVAFVYVGLSGSADRDWRDGSCVDPYFLDGRLREMDLEVIKAGDSGQAYLEGVSSLRLESGAEHVGGMMQHSDDGLIGRAILVVEVDPRLIAPDGIPCDRFNDRSFLGNLSALWSWAVIA